MTQGHITGIGVMESHTSEDKAEDWGEGVLKGPLNEQEKDETRDRGSNWPTLSQVSRPDPIT